MRTSRRLQLGIAAGTATVLFATPFAGAQDPVAGTAGAPETEAAAQSQAVLARVVPFIGLPGVTTSIGLVTAQVAAGTARSSAAAADFGLLGTLAAASAEGSAPAVPGAPTLTLPAPISADSEGTTLVERDPFEAAGGPAAPVGTPGFFAHETASATREPLAARGLVEGPTLRVPGLIELSGGIAEATSAADGAASVVTLDRLDLGAGQVLLSGLRWSAGQAPAADATSGFTLRGLTVAGQDLPVDSPADLAAGLDAANVVLEPLGLVLGAPTTAADPTGGTVEPLVIQLRNPEALVEPSRQASSALAPVISELVTALVAANPDAATAQIVTNAILGSAGGRTGGRIELGGVSARSTLVELADLTGAVAEPFVPPGLVPGAVPPAGEAATDDVALGLDPLVPGMTSVGELPAAGVPAAAAPTPTGATNLAQDATAFGAAGGDGRNLAGLALALGLAAILALAVGDRIRMAALAAK